MIVKYLFVGGAAAFVDISLFAVFAKVLQFNYLIVGIYTFLIATAVNYHLSIRYVFESNIMHTRKKEIFLVYLVSGIGLVFNLTVLYLTIDLWNFEMMLGKLLASGSVFFWNYLIRKYFIFKDISVT